ncbi:MAG: metallophosphoesterase family protein [Pseudomonadota bacterium]
MDAIPDMQPNGFPPGRTCPVDYRYEPQVFAREADFCADTAYAVGGLYGNPYALDAVLGLASAEAGTVRIVFNGDFHWFDVDPAIFEAVSARVLDHVALRGNVETELARELKSAGCGCAYPEWVPDAVVRRSNVIVERLRDTARSFPQLRERLGGLPMFCVGEVGGARIGFVHGDARSLAGWDFAVESLDSIEAATRLPTVFAAAGVDVFASSHTCLPALRTYDTPRGIAAVANNGSAGMPNFKGTRRGLVTRISTRRYSGKALYGVKVGGAHLEAIPLEYDYPRWQKTFLASWPAESAAFESYFDRILRGPEFTIAQARAPSRGVKPRCTAA